MTKTMSIRMDRDNYEFLAELSKAERSDLSKGVRDLCYARQNPACRREIQKGRGFSSVGQMMTIRAEFGVESRIEKEDYLQGLHKLAKVW